MTYHYTRSRAAKPKTTKKRGDPEHQFQKTVVQYLTFALPTDILWTATLSGAHLGNKQREKATEAGLRPGLPDMIFVLPSGAVKMLELKSPRGSLSSGQKDYRDYLGDAFAVAKTLEQVRDALLSWGVTPTREISAANRYFIDPKLVA